MIDLASSVQRTPKQREYKKWLQQYGLKNTESNHGTRT